MITQSDILSLFNLGTSVSTADRFLIETPSGKAVKVSAEWVRAYLAMGIKGGSGSGGEISDETLKALLANDEQLQELIDRLFAEKQNKIVSITHNEDSVDIDTTDDNGDDIAFTIEGATASTAGVMSKDDRKKMMQIGYDESSGELSFTTINVEGMKVAYPDDFMIGTTSPKTLDEYILSKSGGSSTADSFHIFATDTPDSPSLTNKPYTDWVSEGYDLSELSASPNNAVVINSDGRTWRFMYNKVSKEYYFDEFTDPWLLAQHSKISDMLDFKCISGDEICTLYFEYRDSVKAFQDAQSYYNALTDHSSSISSAFDTLTHTYDIYCTEFMDSVISNKDNAPVYFSDYSGNKIPGHTTLGINRETASRYIYSYKSALRDWQIALAMEDGVTWESLAKPSDINNMFNK